LYKRANKTTQKSNCEEKLALQKKRKRTEEEKEKKKNVHERLCRGEKKIGLRRNKSNQLNKTFLGMQHSSNKDCATCGG
jgi:hypothetical protein